MKKVFLYCAIVVFLTVLCCGCATWNFKYCPSGQYNTRWTCKELDIYFDVSEKFQDITFGNTYGQININGEITEIMAFFSIVGTVNFMPTTAAVTETAGDDTLRQYIDGDEWLFIGKCKFYKNKCVITVFNNEKGFLDDSVKTLTFIKGEIPEGAPLPGVPEPSPTPEPENPPVAGRNLSAAERDADKS